MRIMVRLASAAVLTFASIAEVSLLGMLWGALSSKPHLKASTD